MSPTGAMCPFHTVTLSHSAIGRTENPSPLGKKLPEKEKAKAFLEKKNKASKNLMVQRFRAQILRIVTVSDGALNGKERYGNRRQR